MLFHIADAPPHGRRYYVSKLIPADRLKFFDTKPEFDHSTHLGIPAQVQMMKHLNINYQFARVTAVPAMQPHLDQMIKALNMDAKSKDFVKVANMSSPHAITTSVVSAVTAATSRTVGALRDHAVAKVAPPKFDLKAIPEEDKWCLPSAPVIQVEVFMNAEITSISNLCKPTHLEWIRTGASTLFAGAAKKLIGAATSAFGGLLGRLRDGATSDSTTSDSTTIKLASKPFAQGACRYAFRGEIHGDGMCKQKIFKSFIKSPRSAEEYLEQIEVSAAAVYLAKKFMETRSKAKVPLLLIDVVLPLF